ncbi:MAG: hypothetical protein HY646_00535 [Acidobacteria bacterium]|nr:hypothetical protein [Acidobacteriota bacterium]
MDKDEFESKLKLVRRQKEQVEQELEASSEKWRTERRRLNAEIDKLENALAEAKQSPRRAGAAAKPSGIDPVEVAKMQAAADEKLKNATKEWEAERDRLKTQISRLERAVAEAIERSSNPLRATQSARADLEDRIVRITAEKAEVERSYIRDKAAWDEERAKLTSDLAKLKRTAKVIGHTVPEVQEKPQEGPKEDPRVKELEKRLQELMQKWETERRQLNDHAGQLQQAYVEAKAKIENYEAAASSSQHYEAKLQEANRQRESLERDLQKARDDWAADRKRLSAEIERFEKQLLRTSDTRDKVSNEIVEQLRKQYEERLQEAIQQKTQLASQLQSASTLLESERARLSVEISKSKKAGTSGSGGSDGGVNQEAINAEVARVDGMIQEIARLIDDPATELSTIIRKNVEKAELDAYLKGILFSLGKGRGL